MSRIRTIKPEFFSSRTLARVSRDSRYLFIGLWTMCDDFGVMIDAPKKIAGELFPHDEDVDSTLINVWLTELHKLGLIIRCSENNKDIIVIRSWGEHQKVDHPGKIMVISRDALERIVSKSRTSRETLSKRSRLEKEKEKDSLESSLRSDSHVDANGVDVNEPFFPKTKKVRAAAEVELIQAVVGSWNELAARKRLPQVEHITGRRQAQILRRAGDLKKYYDFTDPIDGFASLLGRVAESSFLCGETSAWKSNFDFVVAQSSFTKIMEGWYESSQKGR